MAKKKEQAAYEVTTRIIDGKVQTDITSPGNHLDACYIALLRVHADLLNLNAEINEKKNLEQQILRNAEKLEQKDEPECCSD